MLITSIFMQKASQWIHLAEKPICNYLIYVIYVNKKKILD